MAVPLPDTVFHSGPVFDGHRLRADSAVGVRSGRVVAIGPTDRIVSLAPGAQRIDLAGRLLHPGFTDAHVHALSAGVDRNACDLTDADDAGATLDAIAAYAAATDRDWIVGSGWTMSHFERGCPTAAALDAVVDDRPVFQPRPSRRVGQLASARTRRHRRGDPRPVGRAHRAGR